MSKARRTSGRPTSALRGRRWRAAGILIVVIIATCAPASGKAQTPSVESPSGELPGDEHSIEVAADGTRYIVEEWHPLGDVEASPGQSESTSAEAPGVASATTDAFALHSKPGAAQSIYLDFDGGSLLSSNSWVLEGLSTLLYPGWSLDGASTFSDTELAVVRQVWARMAEDFAPFDVDVTTQEPASGGLWRGATSDTTYGARVAFTSSELVQGDLCGGVCGGVAWIGTFDDITNGEIRSPAWVFPSSLGNNAKYMAEAASHEVGHNLGLMHDGSASSEYYSGSSLWGPLMGSPYSAAVTQWSRGDYLDANNQEDDFAVAVAHGVAVRPDEAGSTPSAALPLADLPPGGGVITSRSDADWYRVTDCTGTLDVQVVTAAVGANLDTRLEVRDATGQLLASAAPATTRTTGGLSGMGASISTVATGGPFYVAVSGAGSGENGAAEWGAGGYDAYGSAGTYGITMTGCSGASADPPDDPLSDDPVVTAPTRPAAPRTASGARGRPLTVRTRWSAPNTGGAAITGYRIQALRIGADGKVKAIRTFAVLPATRLRAELGLSRGRWAVRVKARNSVGWSAYSRRSTAVRSR